ncbi:hypothetical protein BJF82_14355 [Kytococcus sp. CUA-901]|nr:hypothetical protein BJF82_14355 [Kytococcus sp. CUA-901]
MVRSSTSSAAWALRTLPAGVVGRTFLSSSLAWAADRDRLAPPGMSSRRSVVQLAHLAGVLGPQGGAPVHAHAQHLQLLVVDDWAQPGHADSDQGDGVGVGGVGLAALAGGEDPHSRGHLRRHVDHVLAVGDEPGGHVLADPGAASTAQRRCGHCRA